MLAVLVPVHILRPMQASMAVAEVSSRAFANDFFL